VKNLMLPYILAKFRKVSHFSLLLKGNPFWQVNTFCRWAHPN
jgi:hypothetical protein